MEEEMLLLVLSQQ